MLAIFVLLLLGAGGYVGITWFNARKAEATRKAEEEKQRQAEAAKKAEEEKRRQEEAARKAEEEKRRQEEAARKAEEEKRLREAFLPEYEKALEEKTDRLLIWAPEEKKACILIFRYDALLTEPIDTIQAARNLLKQYNRQTSEAVQAYENNDLKAVVQLYRTGLRKLELQSAPSMEQIADLSERIAKLSDERALLVGVFPLPADGCLREELSGGKYLIAHLSDSGQDSKYICEKHKGLPLFLESRDGKWRLIAEEEYQTARRQLEEKERIRREKLAEEELAHKTAEQKAAYRARLSEKRKQLQTMRQYLQTGEPSDLEKLLPLAQAMGLHSGRLPRGGRAETQISDLVFFAELKKDLQAFGGQPASFRSADFAKANGILAVRFPGNPRQGITYSWSPVAGNRPRTVSLWFFRNRQRRHGGGNAMLSYGTKSFGKYFDIETNLNGSLYCAWGEPLAEYAKEAAAEEWHHFAVTYDGKTRKSYLDGKMTSEHKVVLQTAASPLMIGTRINDETHCFVGLLRNVAAYNRALTEEEVRMLQTRGLADDDEQAERARLAGNEFPRRYQTLHELYLLAGKDAGELNALARNRWKLADYDLRTLCRHCRGEGLEPCSRCKNTGICQSCKGTGVKTEQTNIISGKKIGSRSSRVKCPTQCTYCEGHTKKCTSCKGTTGFLNAGALKAAIEKEHAGFCAWIDAQIAEIDQAYEKVKD